MGAPIEKEAIAPTATDIPEESVSNTRISNNDGDSNSDREKVLTEKAPEIEYPQGMKRALLASATLVAVFLIALDQVRIIPFQYRHPKSSLTDGSLDHRGHCNS